MMRTSIAVVALWSARVLAQGDGYVETFESGVNAGGWLFPPDNGQTVPTGGLPGAWRSGVTSSIYPAVVSIGSAMFGGDFRARGVTGVRAALMVGAAPSWKTLRPALVIRTHNGTPNNIYDDYGAFVLSAQPLGPSSQWRVHSFPIPSESSTLPPGWDFVIWGQGPPPPPEWSWDYLIRHVDEMMITYVDPNGPGWEFDVPLGVDEITLLQRGPACYANCDGSTSGPALNILDFACFVQKFALGVPYANCDGSTTPPILNVADFQCFLNAFVAGCP